MNWSRMRLWFNDARIELKRWPRRSLVVWCICLAALIGLWFIAVAAKNATIDAWSAAAPAGPDASESQTASTLAEPTELVILDSLPPPDESALRRIVETAMTLRSRLQLNNDSAAKSADDAGQVAGLAINLMQDQLANNNESFWQPMSEAIAKLEQSVRLGEVSHGPETD